MKTEEQKARRREQLRAAQARWTAKNPEKNRTKWRDWYAAHPEKAKRRSAEWTASNKAKVNAKTARRKSAEIKATPGWANHEKIEEFYFAADFLGMVTGEWHHVDHIVPLQSKLVCGLHTEQNLQVLPASDNLRKSNRHWPDMP
jgi:hypothetical protein